MSTPPEVDTLAIRGRLRRARIRRGKHADEFARRYIKDVADLLALVDHYEAEDIRGEARALAWDEGRSAGADDYRHTRTTRNPYRVARVAAQAESTHD